MQATRDREGSYAFVYFPVSDQKATLDLARLNAKRLRAWWFDTRTRIGTRIDAPVVAGKQEFRSPPYGPDWVLLVEDADAGFGPPSLG